MIINSTSYKVLIGYSASPDPKGDTIKHLTNMDGSINVVDYGARQERISEVQIVELSLAQFDTLANYLLLNSGNKILIKIENQDENPFPDITAGGAGSDEYYVYELKGEGLQQEDFSITNNLFTVKLQFAFAGTDISGVPNMFGTSKIDILVEINTTNAVYIQTDDPTLTILPADIVDNARWLDITDNSLYEWDADLLAWSTSLYTVAVNDSSLGFKNGIFYLSTFASLIYNSNDYIAGIINYESVQLPNQNINISKGPTVSRKDGFQFSVSNSTLFWKTVIDNGINIYNSECTVYIKKDADVIKLMKGKNTKSSFTFTDFKADAEPFILEYQRMFPFNVITDTDTVGERYDNIDPKQLGKSPYVTYGEHQIGALQNISLVKNTVSLASGTTVATSQTPAENIFAKISSVDNTKVYIPKVTSLGLNVLYIMTAIQQTQLTSNHVVKIANDTISGTANIGKSRTITAVVEETEFYVLTISEVFATAPNPNGDASPPKTNDVQIINLIGATYRFQDDEEPSQNFGSFDVNGNFTTNLQLFGLDKDGKEFFNIPSTDFSVNADKNIVSLSLQTATDNTAVETYNTTNGLFPQVISIGSQETSDATLSATTMNTTLGINKQYQQSKAYDNISNDYNFNAIPSRIAYGVTALGDFFTNITPPASEFEDTSTLISRILTSQYALDRELISVLSFPVNHANDSLFIDNNNCRLGLDLFVKSYVKWVYNKNANDTNYEQTKGYTYPMTFTLVLRFKTIAGTYIDDGSWIKTIKSNTLGMPLSNPHNITINNKPSGAVDGFPIVTPVLKQNWSENTGSIQYVINNIFSSVTEMNSLTGVRTADRMPNIQVWVNQTSGSLATQIAESGLWIIDPYSFLFVKASTQPSLNDKFLFRELDPIDVNPIPKKNITTSDIYNVTNISPLKITLEASPDVDDFPKLTGKNLFDISDLMSGGSDVWDTVESMELIFAVDEQAFNEIAKTPITNINLFPYWFMDVASLTQPTIFYFEKVELIDRPLFSAVQGRLIDGVFSKNAQDIGKDILTRIYADKYDLPSYNNLFLNDARASWNFRRQITKAVDSNAMLNELLWNLWAVAIIDEDDQISFKKLDTDTAVSVFDFDESTIINDSVSEVKYRNANEIFQDLRMNYNYNVASEFSKSLQKWGNYLNTGSVVISRTEGNEDLRGLLNTSTTLYNIDYSKEMDFFLHYENFPKELQEWIVKFYGFNAWSFKFATSINNIFDGSGSQVVKLMDVITVDLSFFTGGEVVQGFVNSIEHDLYSGKTRIGIYIIDPPGKYGPLCNPYNDALNVAIRDISGWTELNGKQNDAGNVATRSLGSYIQKDAGEVGNRNLTC